MSSHTLTPVELFALDTVPIEIVPTPGSGKAVFVLSVVARAVPGGVDYDEGSLTFAYGDESGQSVSGGTNYPAASPGDVVNTAFGDVYNDLPTGSFEGLSIVAVNSGSQPTTGDGTIDVTITYITVTL
jgi:hypothetical protein